MPTIRHKLLGPIRREDAILHNELLGKAALVQGGVHGVCFEERVQEESGQAVERREEVGEGPFGAPEGAAVVAEEVGLDWDEVGWRMWLCLCLCLGAL